MASSETRPTLDESFPRRYEVGTPTRIEGDPGLLSFPVPGWTLALDVPARTRGLASLLAALDRLVVEAGGRVYLAKDSRVPAEVLAEMYPRLAEFRKLRAELDPAGILASDLSRRLGL